jgi:hypothetical protein
VEITVSKNDDTISSSSRNIGATNNRNSNIGSNSNKVEDEPTI